MPIITVKSEKGVKRLLTATTKCAYGKDEAKRTTGWYYRPRPGGLQLAVTNGHMGFILDVTCPTDLAPDDAWRAPQWDALQRYTRALGGDRAVDLPLDLGALPLDAEALAPLQKVLDLNFADAEVVSTNKGSKTRGWVDFNLLAQLAPVLGLIQAHCRRDACAQVTLRKEGVTVTAPGFVGFVCGSRP